MFSVVVKLMCQFNFIHLFCFLFICTTLIEWLNIFWFDLIWRFCLEIRHCYSSVYYSSYSNILTLEDHMRKLALKMMALVNLLLNNSLLLLLLRLGFVLALKTNLNPLCILVNCIGYDKRGTGSHPDKNISICLNFHFTW